MRSLLFAAALVLAFAAVQSPADVLTSLATERSWIGYSPRNYNPNINQQPSEASMRADLQVLYDAGWRNVFNYTLDGSQRDFPRIAKELGFKQVLAGVFYFDDGQLAREKSAAQAEDQYIDGYIVGNEGLAFGRYGPDGLLNAMEFFAGFGKPITTTEVGGLYLVAPPLADAGNFVTVNIQPWFDSELDPSDPVGMAQAVVDEYNVIKALRPDRLVVIKEAWWPTDGHPAATEANQVAFWQALANSRDASGDPVLFLWGESHDQPWKTGEVGPFGSLGPDWGFYESNGAEKRIVDALADVYTADYPVNFLAGDYDRDGVIDANDYAVWSGGFGETVDIAGRGADGNFDRVIDAADYTIWRDAFDLNSTAITTPEPSAGAMAGLAVVAAYFRRSRSFSMPCDSRIRYAHPLRVVPI